MGKVGRLAEGGGDRQGAVSGAVRTVTFLLMQNVTH